LVRFSTDAPVTEDISSEGEDSVVAVEEAAVEKTEESTEEADAVVAVEETAVEEAAETTESTEEAVAVVAEVDADEGKKLFVGNLPTEFTQETIAALFAPYGTVSEISVPVDRFTGAIRGFAFITLSDKESTAKAVEEMNGKDIEGRIVTVNLQRKEGDPKPERVYPEVDGTKLYVGNLPFDATREEIMEYFGQYGTVSDCFVPVDRATNRPRGFAFVTMAKEDAETAIKNTDDADFMGRTIQVNISLPRGKAPPNRRSQSKTKLYIGNLSYDTDEETLTSLFQDYGEILDIYIPTDRETGRMRGFAFVTMEPESAQRAAEETDGFELYGRILRVNEAQPKGRQSEGGGGGGGGSWGNDQGNDSWGN